MIEFIFSAFSGVAGNYIYETLKKHFKSDKLNELVEYRNSDNIENFKRVIESAIEFNQKLEEDLKNLSNQRTTNIESGKNTYYSEGDMYINEKEEKNDPKH